MTFLAMRHFLINKSLEFHEIWQKNISDNGLVVYYQKIEVKRKFSNNQQYISRKNNQQEMGKNPSVRIL